MNDPSHLFTLRFRLSGGLATLTAWETVRRKPNGEPIYNGSHIGLDAELRWKPTGAPSRTIFPRGATYCGVPAHQSIDGDSARALVCSLFAMRPGDTDSEYFESYTQEQLDWASRFGDELALASDDPLRGRGSARLRARHAGTAGAARCNRGQDPLLLQDRASSAVHGRGPLEPSRRQLSHMRSSLGLRWRTDQSHMKRLVLLLLASCSMQVGTSAQDVCERIQNAKRQYERRCNLSAAAVPDCPRVVWASSGPEECEATLATWPCQTGHSWEWPAECTKDYLYNPDL